MPSEGTSLMIEKVKPSYENNDVFAFNFGRSNTYSTPYQMFDLSDVWKNMNFESPACQVSKSKLSPDFA